MIAGLPALLALLAAAPTPIPVQSGDDPDQGFARARAAITRLCEGDQACYDAQLAHLVRYVRIMAAFRDPDGATAARCMRAGLVERGGERLVDWSIAGPCMQAAAQGLPIGGELRRQ